MAAATNNLIREGMPDFNSPTNHSDELSLVTKMKHTIIDEEAHFFLDPFQNQLSAIEFTGSELWVHHDGFDFVALNVELQ